MGGRDPQWTQRPWVWPGEGWEEMNKNIKRCMTKGKEQWIGQRCSETEEIWGRTTVTGHTNLWKTWPLWNKEKLLLTKIVQENASQKKKRYWTNGQNTALSCTITRPVELHQYWTVPRQIQKMTTPSFAKKCMLQYNHWRKGSQLELTKWTSQQNWSKQVERMQLLLSQQSIIRSGRLENGQHHGSSP